MVLCEGDPHRAAVAGLAGVTLVAGRVRAGRRSRVGQGGSARAAPSRRRPSAISSATTQSPRLAAHRTTSRLRSRGATAPVRVRRQLTTTARVREVTSASSPSIVGSQPSRSVQAYGTGTAPLGAARAHRHLIRGDGNAVDRGELAGDRLAQCRQAARRRVARRALPGGTHHGLDDVLRRTGVRLAELQPDRRGHLPSGVGDLADARRGHAAGRVTPGTRAVAGPVGAPTSALTAARPACRRRRRGRSR